MTPIYAYQLMSCHIPISCNVSAQHDALNECIRLFTHLSELWPTGHPVVLISDSAARCPDWKVPAEKTPNTFTSSTYDRGPQCVRSIRDSNGFRDRIRHLPRNRHSAAGRPAAVRHKFWRLTTNRSALLSFLSYSHNMHFRFKRQLLFYAKPLDKPVSRSFS